MSPNLDAFLRSWSFAPGLLTTLLVTAGIYMRGWRWLARRSPARWHQGKTCAFLGGLLIVYLALASPIETFAGMLLQLHMAQHLLLMMAVPPLLWLGAPFIPLLRGLPQPVRTVWVAPLLRSAALRSLFRQLTHPAVALLVLIVATWLWHIPAAYELALSSDGWHYLQHGCFLAAGLAFWYPVVRPYPGRPSWSHWLLVPYLLAADVQNTILAALLTFSGRVLYPHYDRVPRLGNMTALQDQAAAGVLMWVPGSLAYLLPLFAIGVRLLAGPASHLRLAKFDGPRTRRIALPLLANRAPAKSERPAFDLVRLPFVGPFLRWRHARLALQTPLMLVAGLVIYDGLCGPQVTPMNLAGVLPWIHWRGAVIFALLALGNLFCMACPFMLPRTLARRWLPAGRAWPRWLRSKWLAVGVVALFLWAYEAFALWDSPWWTAWLVVAYFGAAFVVDSLFRGAAFCKYLCPIGQFNFVQALVSPVTVGVRDAQVCATCQTKDCIRGRAGIPGCELNLYQPRKVGNMDCTFCLDCVHACPHDNVGLIAVQPGNELEREVNRSGIGRFTRRLDLAALVVVLVFGAFANAAGMVAPVVEWQDRMQTWAGWTSRLPIVSAYYVLTLLIAPFALISIAAALTRRLSASAVPLREVAARYCYALVPLGFAMWLAHYSFHLLTSYDAIMPAAWRCLAMLGWTDGASAAWEPACCRPIASWLERLEIVMLDVGLLLSLYTAYRITQASHSRHVVRTLAPWAAVIFLLFAAGVWIILQPMQMRGAM